MLSRITLRRFSTSPFLQDRQNSHENSYPRAISSLPFQRENQTITFTAFAARFQANERYINIKDRGMMAVEFTPKVASPMGPGRHMYNTKDKKAMVLFAEDFYYILNFNDTASISRMLKGYKTTAKFIKKNEGVQVQLSAAEPTAFTCEVVLTSSEFFTLQQYLDYSLPYIMGWFAMGNPKLAEQNIIMSEDASKAPSDPFANI